MKIRLIFLSLFLYCLGSKADTDAIRLLLSDGMSYTFMIDASPIVTYDSNIVTISTDKQCVTVNLADEVDAKIVFVDLEAETDIKQIKYPKFCVTQSEIKLTGLAPLSAVLLYGINGQLISQKYADENGMLIMQKEGKGIIIVKTSNASIKIEY